MKCRVILSLEKCSVLIGKHFSLLIYADLHNKFSIESGNDRSWGVAKNKHFTTWRGVPRLLQVKWAVHLTDGL